MMIDNTNHFKTKLDGTTINQVKSMYMHLAHAPFLQLKNG